MSIVEWGRAGPGLPPIPFDLITVEGTLELNRCDGSEPYYMLIPESCLAISENRVTKDNIPQKDGSILHKRFRTGYTVALTIQYWESPSQPACGGTLVDMHDVMMRHLRAMLNESGRLIWEPTDHDARFFDEMRWLKEVTTDVQAAFVQVSFALDSPFPYALDFEQSSTVIADGTIGTTLDNTGSAPMYPVIRVDGPTDSFVIRNETTDEEIIYDSSFPGAQPIGAGDYAEIDTFKDTIYENGDQTNLKPGIDIEDSDFFALEVGPNQITIQGDGSNPTPTVTFLWQAAWA